METYAVGRLHRVRNAYTDCMSHTASASCGSRRWLFQSKTSHLELVLERAIAVLNLGRVHLWVDMSHINDLSPRGCLMLSQDSLMQRQQIPQSSHFAALWLQDVEVDDVSISIDDCVSLFDAC